MNICCQICLSQNWLWACVEQFQTLCRSIEPQICRADPFEVQTACKAQASFEVETAFGFQVQAASKLSNVEVQTARKIQAASEVQAAWEIQTDCEIQVQTACGFQNQASCEVKAVRQFSRLSNF